MRFLDGVVVDLSGALLGVHCRINLARATPQELDKLEPACQLATFGVNNKNVYDGEDELRRLYNEFRRRGFWID